MLNRFLATLNVRRKFALLLVVQALLLAGVTSLGWLGMQHAKASGGQLVVAVQKSKMIGRALNDSNVLRTVHISMLAAAKNSAYQGKRIPRMKEYDQRMQVILQQFPTLPWTAQELPLAREGMARMKEYMDGFDGMLARAQARPEAEAVPELMEGNVQIQRQAREALEKLQNLVLASAETTVHTDDRQGSAGQGWILGIALAGLLAGVGFVSLVARQIGRGVADLEQTMGALHRGDLTVQSRVPGRDELNHISHTLNGAMGHLREDLQAGGLRPAAPVHGVGRAFFLHRRGQARHSRRPRLRSLAAGRLAGCHFWLFQLFMAGQMGLSADDSGAGGRAVRHSLETTPGKMAPATPPAHGLARLAIRCGRRP